MPISNIASCNFVTYWHWLRYLLIFFFVDTKIQEQVCITPYDAVADRKCKFLKKFIVSDNMLCQVFKDVAMDELALLPSNAY